MARGKNTPALFEVIRNAQQKQKEQALRDQQRQEQQATPAAAGGTSPAARLLQSPVYWFKGKHAHAAANGLDTPVMRETPAPAAPAIPAAGPTPVVEAAPPFARPPATPVPVAPQVVALPPRPAVVRPSAPTPAEEAARQVRAELSAQEAPAAEPFFGTPASPFDAFDDGYDVAPLPAEDEGAPAGQPPLTFSYTTAIVSAFAVVVAFAVAYVAFHAARQPGTPAIAEKPTRPDVLRLPLTPAAVTEQPAAPEADDRANVANDEQAVELEQIGKPVPVPTDVKRVIGQQYLVLQSFPSDEDAKDLVKYLAQNGVRTTAEKALPGYARSWTSVITVRGFDHTRNNPAYARYSAALADLLKKWAGDSKFRKTFKADVYTWRAAR